MSEVMRVIEHYEDKIIEVNNPINIKVFFIKNILISELNTIVNINGTLKLLITF